MREERCAASIVIDVDGQREFRQGDGQDETERIGTLENCLTLFMVPCRNGSSETSNRYGGSAPAFSSMFHDDDDDEFVDDEAREKPFESGGDGRAFGTEAPKGMACFSLNLGGGACSYRGGAGLGRERGDGPPPLLVIRVGDFAPVEMVRCVSVEVGRSVVRDATRAYGEGEGELG
jgi:hypothetical protein